MDHIKALVRNQIFIRQQLISASQWEVCIVPTELFRLAVKNFSFDMSDVCRWIRISNLNFSTLEYKKTKKKLAQYTNWWRQKVETVFYEDFHDLRMAAIFFHVEDIEAFEF